MLRARRALEAAPAVWAQIRNIGRAHAWFDRIRSGKTFDEIDEAEAPSKRRVQHMIDLAVLAPDIFRDILDGKQPLGIRSDWCKTHEIPAD